MKYFYFLLLCIVVAPTAVLAQQTGTLTGTVSDANNGSPLPGANIGLLELPTKGTATDINGLYTIPDIPVGTHTVVVRYVGFREVTATVNIQANQATEQDFFLDEDFLNMEEIVVTGQGASIEKRRLSSDVSILNSREIESAPVASIDELLQGRVTGATVRAQSAQPGQGMNINFRGITSAFASQTPVIYIDGIRVDNRSSTSLSQGGEETSALSELLTSDIERVEITKGGAASTLYGSDAANGVIQIFTKRGISGEPTITIRTDQGVDIPDTKFVQDTGFSFPNQVTDPEHPDFGQTSFLEDNFLQNSYFQKLLCQHLWRHTGPYLPCKWTRAGRRGCSAEQLQHPVFIKRQPPGKYLRKTRYQLYWELYPIKLPAPEQRNGHSRPLHQLPGRRCVFLFRSRYV